MNRDSAVSIVTGYGLEGRGVSIWVPVGATFSPLCAVQAGYKVNPASYPIGTEGSFPWGLNEQNLKLTISN
jgi:hypothetical protein